MTQKLIGRLHILTDFHFQQRYSHAELARIAAAGGADTIQFRQKCGGIRHILKEAMETADVCRDANVAVLIDDRIDVALACRADGVHLGQTDFPISEARGILGEEAIIGGTATTLEEALRAQDAGADYVGFGPVFETGSKYNPASVKGIRMLGKVSLELDIPVIAIAGITARRVEQVVRAGAHGVAIMTAVTTADDPATATREIRDALDLALSGAGVSAPAGSEDGRSDAVG